MQEQFVSRDFDIDAQEILFFNKLSFPADGHLSAFCVNRFFIKYHCWHAILYTFDTYNTCNEQSYVSAGKIGYAGTGVP